MANKFKKARLYASLWFLGLFWLIYFSLLAPYMISAANNELVIGGFALGVVMLVVTYYTLKSHFFNSSKED